MKKSVQTILILIIIAAAVGVGSLILRSKPPKAAGSGEGGHEHAHDEHAEAGRVAMKPAKAKAAGIVLEEAGTARILDALKIYGRIAPNEEAMTHVTGRFPGVVRSVGKRLGDAVAKGEVLAVIESNVSLRTYNVTSDVAGTVTKREVTPGEFVSEQKVLFTVADLSTVWADFQLYRDDAVKVKRGQRVQLEAAIEGRKRIEATIDYVAPTTAEATQTVLARAVLDNRDGSITPGLLVNGLAVMGENEVEVAVRPTALHTLDQRTVVFVQEGDSFEARVVEIGRRDADWVEILNGILPGETYATTNSFLIKAEIGKGAAEHEH